MLFKEKGYDEFLAERIKTAREDVRAGHVYSGEESYENARLALEQRVREFEQAKAAEMISNV